MDVIRSTSNPIVKRARAAARGKENGLTVLEGDRLVDEARRQGLRPEAVLVAETRPERAGELAAAGLGVHVVTDSLLASLSQLTTSPGILALVPVPAARPLADLTGTNDGLVVVAAGLQDPGNLGALARTAEAFGASGVVCLAGGCSPWSAKALRGSMGSFLRLAVCEVPAARVAWDGLAALGFRHVCANTRGGADPRELDWGGRVALWTFAETGEVPVGIADLVEDAERVSIPMAGEVESLNVTTAAAVLLYAAASARARAGRPA